MADSSNYGSAESVESVAQGLIPNFHPELATARISYLFTEKASKKGGRELAGKVAKVAGRWAYLTELDFVVEVALPVWNDLAPDARQALVDHLLEHMTAEEDETTGDFSWKTREPDVREFSTILERHGVWNETLSGFVQIAQRIDLSGIISEELGQEIEEELDLNSESDV